jgi:cell shape-determining protein MreD
MSAFNTISILLVAFLVVFFQGSFDGLRVLLGAQVDLLPSLMVYTSLSSGLPTLTLLAVVGGLFFDSMSANPLGISILPLFLIGFLIQRYRGLILREQLYAQFVLGFAASAAAPLMSVLLLLNTDSKPLLSWFSLWQWLVMTLVGGAVTPLWFGVFDRINRALNYRRLDETTFRPDREIKRGRQ